MVLEQELSKVQTKLAAAKAQNDEFQSNIIELREQLVGFTIVLYFMNSCLYVCKLLLMSTQVFL